MSSPVYRREPRMSSVGSVMTEVPVTRHDHGAKGALRDAIERHVDIELSDPAGAGASGQDAELDLTRDVPLVLSDLESAGWVLVRLPVSGGEST